MRVSKPWAIATVLLVCLIWGNSLVPGTGSGSLSLTVLSALRGALGAVGLPYAWLTNFIVRKCAHFSEYLLLGLCMSNALDAHRVREPGTFVLVAALLVVIPSLDETIQLFVPGRVGAVTDVMIDCSGAAVGVALHCLARAIGEKCCAA